MISTLFSSVAFEGTVVAPTLISSSASARPAYCRPSTRALILPPRIKKQQTIKLLVSTGKAGPDYRK